MRCRIATMALLATATLAPARNAGAPASVVEGVGVEQRLGAAVPLDATFTDSSGRRVTLGDCFRGRPVLLTPVYFECPALCTVTLNQLGRSLNALTESAGADFDIVTFSINPAETPELAAKKKAGYLRAYGRPTANAGWHFLTGSEAEIRKVTDAIGFRYRWDEASRQFVHAGAAVVVSPSGKVSRYFLGVDYPPTDLHAAMRAALREQVGPPAEQVFLYCFRFDPTTGKYGLIVSRVLKVMAASLVLALVGSAFLMNRLHAARLKGGGHVS